MNKGWISLHRKIQNHWIWEKPLYFKAWIWILMKANHSQSKVLIGSELVEISRGEFVSSLSKITYSTGMTIKQTRTFLSLLEKDQMVVKTRGGKWTKLIICKYEDYQVQGHDEGTLHGNIKASKRQANGKQTVTNNNSNKVNNVKEIKILVSELKNSDELYEKITFSYWQLFNSNLNKFGINSTDLKKAKKKNWVTNIRLMMENDNRTQDEIFEVFDFLKNNEFWGKIILSTAKLRQKFETLLIQAKTNENNPHNSNTIASAKITHERAKQILKQMRHEN